MFFFSKKIQQTLLSFLIDITLTELCPSHDRLSGNSKAHIRQLEKIKKIYLKEIVQIFEKKQIFNKKIEFWGKKLFCKKSANNVKPSVKREKQKLVTKYQQDY